MLGSCKPLQRPSQRKSIRFWTLVSAASPETLQETTTADVRYGVERWSLTVRRLPTVLDGNDHQLGSEKPLRIHVNNHARRAEPRIKRLDLQHPCVLQCEKRSVLLLITALMQVFASHLRYH